MLYIGWSKILITVDFTYVAFEGYEVIAQAADETIDPKRKTPWIALMFTGCMVIIVAVLFPIKVAAVFVSNSG
jgi:amino acid transporter